MIRMAMTVCAAVLIGTTAGAVEVPKPAAAIYVATNGSDAWSGKLAAPDAKKTDGPFKTLERARDAVRKLKPARPERPITVMVRGGVYTLGRTFALDARDSGTEAAPVTFRAYPGEKAILAGGPTLPLKAFKRITDPKILWRLPAPAREHVVQVDLTACGVGRLTPWGSRLIAGPPGPELFFNDQRMTVARWPNEGWATIGKIIAPGSSQSQGEDTSIGGAFEYSGDEPSRWNVDQGVWLHGYWCYDWRDETLKVKSIDTASRVITLAAAATYGVRQGNPSPRRYYAVNLIEELDSPGEYFIDTATRRLYFWPPAPLAGARIVVSTLNAPLVSIDGASNVILRGFTVEASQADGIEVNDCTGVRIQACEVRNTRGLGIRVDGGKADKIEACDIHDTGAGGIVLSGGDRKTLTPAGHEAVNNHIWRYSCLKLTYANAIQIQGVGNRAAHNLIHDAPHQAVSIHGNDNVFEYNVVHDVCMSTDDCGAFYKGRDPSCRGNIIRYNFWHTIGSPMGHGNAAIYFDDGDGGDTVFGNVFYHCGDPGKGSFGTVFSHGGHDNTAENNIFIECKRALGSAPWDDKRWKETIDGGNGCFWTEKLLKEVDITRPPYTTHYPNLIGFMDPKPGQPRNNHAQRNVVVNCGQVSSGNWQVPADQNWSSDHDPGFVDAARGNFRLKPESEVFAKVPGFKPIPFEKMGLVKEELRLVVRKEPWPYAKDVEH